MKAVVRRSIIDQVLEQIQQMISSEGYEAGMKLPPEVEMCRILGVSRSTVREAFRMLQAMDYVEIKQGRGAFVKNKQPNSPETIKQWFGENAPQLNDFMDVRLALETLALKIAVKQATEEEILRLYEIERSFEQAVEERDVMYMAQYDEDFHSEIVAMTHNTLMINIYQLVVHEFKKYRNKAFALERYASNAVEPHGHILQAIRDRDERLGVLYTEDHLKISKRDMELAAREEK